MADLDRQIDRAFETATRSRLESSGARASISMVHTLAASLVLNNALHPLMWLVAIQVLMAADGWISRRYLAATPGPGRKALQWAIIASSAICRLAVVGLALWLVIYGGPAGALVAMSMLAGLLLGMTSFLHGDRLFVGITSAPAALGLVLAPFLPHLGTPASALMGALGVLVSLGGFAAHLLRAAVHNKKMLSRAEQAGREAMEGRAEAERANRAKSVLLANMSHELRTPLNAVIGYAEIVTEEVAEAGMTACAEDAGRIKHAGHRLLLLIDDLLELAEIDAGRTPVDIAPFEVAALVRAAVENAAPAARATGATISTDMAPGLGYAASDAEKIQGALADLLSNAVKFAPGGVIEVTAYRDGDALVLTVSDTGMGMSAEQAATLFEPFAHANSSLASRGRGTGLGLAITHRMIRLVGGDLSVRTAPGCGATFTIRVPAVMDAAAAPCLAEAA